MTQQAHETMTPSGLTETRRTRIRGIIDNHRSFRFCGPSDDPDEITAVTEGYRHLVVQLQRLATPILTQPTASLLNSLVVEVNDLYSAYAAHSEIETIILDVEEALESAKSLDTLPAKSLNLLLQEKEFAAVYREFSRCTENIETDPPAAITAACSILESVCKVYIEDKSLAMPSKQSIAPLWKIVSDHIGFDPSRVEDHDIRKILSGLTSVVNGIGSLRTHIGSAHGRGNKSYRVQVRHARLAVNSSYTLVGFVLETWQKQDSR